MKKRVSLVIVTWLVSSVAAFAFSSPVFAWSQASHAYVAKTGLGIENRYLLNYNARLGSTVPDFFWYLRDRGLIDEDSADILHGDTTQPCVDVDDTTWFYDIASDQVRPWQILLRFFTEGIKTHVCADIVAHNTDHGYLDGTDMWVDSLLEKIPWTETESEEFREAAHIALEFSVDALLVAERGLQLADLFFCDRQADLLEKAVRVALGQDPGFDVSLEFKKYLTLMRGLEKAAALYAPYLISAGLDGHSTLDFDSEPLTTAQRELSEESLDLYTKVFMILLQYPEEIYTTINEPGKDWKEDALPHAVDFCKNPEFCSGDAGGN